MKEHVDDVRRLRVPRTKAMEIAQLLQSLEFIRWAEEHRDQWINQHGPDCHCRSFDHCALLDLRIWLLRQIRPRMDRLESFYFDEEG